MTETPFDTIAAIATAPGEAGVAVIRISGPRAVAIADTVFRCGGPAPGGRPPNTFVFGRVVEPGGRAVDEALCLIMRAPRSYTGEDTIELQCHGGAAASRAVLRCALDAGARLAEPGEFTRRAFLNGRLDLLQAEAVLDLIRSQSDRSAAAALDQLEGALSRRFNDLYDRLMEIAANLEATLDFVEEDLPPGILDGLTRRLEEQRAVFHRLLETWDEGRLLREGAVAVISGRPNAGKSTLLNGLLGHDRAIVSASPGTTRDSIEESLILDGIPVRLVDTAGLRTADCDIEQAGITRTRSLMERADVHIRVIDASHPLEGDDIRFLQEHAPDRGLLVLNKIDLGEAVAPRDVPRWDAVRTILLHTEGIESCREWIRKKIASDTGPEPRAVISERHRRLLVEALEDVDAAADMLEGEREDLIPPSASRLREGLECLGAATGKVYEEELLDSIFSRFCIGK